MPQPPEGVGEGRSGDGEGTIVAGLERPGVPTRLEEESGEAEDADETGGPSDVVRRALRWLRELHRGYAHTGHLPRRRR